MEVKFDVHVTSMTLNERFTLLLNDVILNGNELVSTISSGNSESNDSVEGRYQWKPWGSFNVQHSRRYEPRFLDIPMPPRYPYRSKFVYDRRWFINTASRFKYKYKGIRLSEENYNAVKEYLDRELDDYMEAARRKSRIRF